MKILNQGSTTGEFGFPLTESAQFDASLSILLSAVEKKFGLQVIQKTTAQVRWSPDGVVGARDQASLAGAARGSE